MPLTKNVFSLIGLVVLYHPKPDVVENIQSYLGEVESLLVVDNSEETGVKDQVLETIRHWPDVIIIHQGSNIGLAKALNLGAQEAIHRGGQWLLTMDQDSFATQEMLPRLKEAARGPNMEDVAILSPFHTDSKHESAPCEEVEEALTVMTSGNLLNLSLYQNIGPFLEILFIDKLDEEYCLRARLHGYRVLRVNQAVLKHQLGNQKVHFWGFISTHHSPLRRYYITRNCYFVARIYKKHFPDYAYFVIKECWKDLIKIILVENQKFAKLSAICRGWLDSYKLNKHPLT